MHHIKHIKIYLFFIALFTFCNQYYCQTNNKIKIDSLEKLIDKNYTNGTFDKQITLKNATTLYYLSKEIGFVDGQIEALLEEAKVYFIHGDIDRALLKINEGLDLAKKKKDYNALCRFLLMYQKIMLQMDHLSVAKNILLKAEEYNKLVKSESDKSINNVFILLAKADVLTIDNKKTNSLKIINLKKESYAVANSLDKSNSYKKFSELFSLQSLASSLIFLGKTNEAKKYIEKADEILLTYPDKSFTIINLMINGQISNAEKKYEDAIQIFLKAIDLAKKADNKYLLFEIYPMLSEAYIGVNDYQTSAFYAKKYKHLLDSIDIVKKQMGDVTFVNNINQKALDIKNNKNNNYLLVLGILAIIVVGVLIIYLRNKKIRDHKKNKITEKIADNDPEKTKELIVLAKEDINAFYTEFQKAYPTFYKNLQENYPELNISDINFCSFIKMNFNIKEIAHYTNSTVRAAEARKYRITKKMGLKKQNELYITLLMIN